MSVCVRERETRRRRGDGGGEHILRHERTPKLFGMGFSRHKTARGKNCRGFLPPHFEVGGEKKQSPNEEGCAAQTRTLWNQFLLLTNAGHQQSPKRRLSTRNTGRVSCQGQAVHRNCVFGHNSATLTMYLFTPKRKIRFLEELSTFFPPQ